MKRKGQKDLTSLKKWLNPTAKKNAIVQANAASTCHPTTHECTVRLNASQAGWLNHRC